MKKTVQSFADYIFVQIELRGQRAPAGSTFDETVVLFYDTDVRATFERARREQHGGAASGRLNGSRDRLNAGLWVARHVDGDGGARRLEGGELAVEERRGHVAVFARRNARGD